MLADNTFSRPKILDDEVVQCEYLAGNYLLDKIWVNGPLVLFKYGHRSFGSKDPYSMYALIVICS